VEGGTLSRAERGALAPRSKVRKTYRAKEGDTKSWQNVRTEWGGELAGEGGGDENENAQGSHFGLGNIGRPEKAAI